MSTEEWRPAPRYEGIYEVSNLGSVRRVVRAVNGRGAGPLKHSLDRNGYPRVDLRDRQRRWNALVHQLVIEAFVGPRPVGMETRHLNGDSLDPRLVNLAYGTHAENMRDMSEHGRSRANDTHCRKGHPYTEDGTRIDGRGSRVCGRCYAASRRRSAHRKRQRRAELADAGALYFVNVRRWGRANGYEVADLGRISPTVLNAYVAAHRVQAAVEERAS